MVEIQNPDIPVSITNRPRAGWAGSVPGSGRILCLPSLLLAHTDGFVTVVKLPKVVTDTTAPFAYHPDAEHSQSMLLPWGEKQNFASIHDRYRDYKNVIFGIGYPSKSFHMILPL